MKLMVIGSSSKGNGYILRANDGQTLLIEAGVPLMEVKKALNFDLTKICGVLVSHLHGDHAGKLHEYIAAGIKHFPNWPGPVIKTGELSIKSFSVVHDVECHGFLIDHPESGLICFLTDTQYSPFRFPGVSQWLIEANFDQRILDDNVLNGRIPAAVRNRVMKSHMSLQTCKELLQSNDLSKTRNIVLLHLSDGNSNAAAFKSEIEGLTGKLVTIADKGVQINLNNNVF